MNLFKKTEAMLYNYKNTIAEMKNIRLEIDDIEQNFRGIGAVLYNDMPGAHSIASTVENEVEKKEQKIEQLTRMMIKKENEISRINNALETLTERERMFIELRYFEKLTYVKVSEKMEMHEITMYDYRKKIIDKMTSLLFIANY